MSKETSKETILPRLIRFRDVGAYLGMDRNRFNREVRPYITQIPIGVHGIAFDRLDLDEWVEQYKHRSGRPAVVNLGSNKLWDAKYRQASVKEANTGISKNKSSDADFERALAQVALRRRSATSTSG